jgi:biotin carboxylase
MAAARNKYLARKRFHAAGLLVPAYFRVSASADPSAVARQSSYPCVLKPLGLSGSRGVIRADTETGFIAAFERIRAILAQPEIRRERDPANDFIHVESYIPGRELALEGIVTAGRLRMLALFDKPDPLDGPFFEETIYVTPSREPPCSQREILDTVRRAVEALGFRHGPVHAEIRVNSQGVWILEAAGRPIGGLCAQALRFEHDRGLEELILRHSLGEDIEPLRPARPASGVMMIPIPQPGVYHAARGEDRAAAIAGIDEVVITAKLGQKLVPLPEGQSYLGFIFASGHTPADVEASLRAAHAELEFDLAGVLPVIR